MRGRSRASCSRTAGSARCVPTCCSSSPSSRASTAPSRCSRRRCTRRRSRPALQAAIQCRLAWSARFKKGFDGALEHARASLELADEVDDDALRVDALEMMTFLGSAVGDPEATAYAERAHEIAVATGDARLVRRARLALVDVPRSSRPRCGARALLEREYEESHERDELSAAEALHGSPGSSCGPAAGSSRPSTPSARTT